MVQKTTTAEKREHIIMMLRGPTPSTSKQIQDALFKNFGTRVHSSVIRQARDELGVTSKRPAKKTKRAYNKRPKLTDAQIKLMVGASSSLPPNIAKVAARLRNLLDIHHVEFITVYRDKPNVRFARYTESEATL